MGTRKAVLNQLNVVVRDMVASADFYRRLGAEIPQSGGANYHANCGLGNDFDLSLDIERFAAFWNKGWADRADLKGRVVLGFSVESRAEVDSQYAEMTGAGYRGLQPPFDAFWGSRYAIIEDPNGVAVGLMSPSDPAKRFNPGGEWSW